jgi:hypothetical protein
MADAIPIEAEASGTLIPDRRRRMPAFLSVRLVAIDDVHLPAGTGQEVDLDAFYAGRLGFERRPADDGLLIYRSQTHCLVLHLKEMPVPHDTLTPTQLEVDDLTELSHWMSDAGIPYDRQCGIEPGVDRLVFQDPAGNWLAATRRVLLF